MRVTDTTSAAQDLVESGHSPGVALRTRRWGEGAPRFLFIHGFGEGSFVWDHVVTPALPYGAAVAVDLRGHGESPHDPARAYGVQYHTADVLAAVQRHFTSPLLIVGHSLGAVVAMHLAPLLRRQVLGLVLVDGGPEFSPDAIAHLREEFARQPWHYRTLDEYTLKLEARFPMVMPALLHSIARAAVCEDSMGGFCLRCDRALTVFDDGPDDESLWPLFRSIRCPVLLMRGAASAHLQRSVAERMTRELPNCSLETIRNAGHAIMLDNPVGFIAALRRFITRLRIPTSGSGK